MIARCAVPLTLLLALLAPPAAHADAPPLDALVGRISTALGGPAGGRQILDAAPAVELVFRRTVRASHSAREITADHRYVEHGERRRIDVRIVEGEGKDSAAVIAGDGWLVVEGEVHAIDTAAVEAQIGEFEPRRLWSVPFALAAEGREILHAASLEVVGKETSEDGSAVIVLVGKDQEGEETSRLVVDARTYRPTTVQFVSSSGRVEYRYGDYRELKQGLVVPFEREFLRNGSRVSRTVVTFVGLQVPRDESALFDRSITTLAAIKPPKRGPAPK